MSTLQDQEVFRFVTVRGIQKASVESLKGRLILCDDTTDSSASFKSALSPNTSPVPSSKEETVDVIAKAIDKPQDFFKSSEMIKELTDLTIPIAHLDSWLLDHNDTVSPSKLKKEILSLGKITTLEELIKSTPYPIDRRRVSASLSAASLMTDKNERLRAALVRAMYIFGLIEELARENTVLKLPEDVFAFLAFATVILPHNFPRPADALARPPSIADLKVVKQKVIRYEMGDIAHIENVLRNEYKSRIHRRKDVREETLTTESERETSEERELQTTERFEMQQEASSVISDDMHFEAGATINASYGPTVSATVTAGFEMNHAQEESKKTASTFAREVMERSAKRIRERTRTQRIVKTISEVEETNTHGIDNKGKDEHIIGIYRYVDKVYEAQVYNYGARLLLEFIVPEPASFIKQLRNKVIDVDMKRPDEPLITERVIDDGSTNETTTRPLKPTDITQANYLEWAARYYVQDIKPPSEDTIQVPLAWAEKAEPETGISPEKRENFRKLYKIDQSLAVPKGYKATHVRGIIGVSDTVENIALVVGSTNLKLEEIKRGTAKAFSIVFSFNEALNPDSKESVGLVIDKIPVGLVVEQAWGYEITMMVECTLLPSGLREWQLATYSQIMRAYFELKSMYDQKVAAVEIQQGVAIEGRNPAENRKTERIELKKHVIAMLGQNYFTHTPDKEAIKIGEPEKYPEIDFEVARAERDYIQWFEQAFEWQNMTFVYYPYYWGKKFDWKEEALAQDPDPLFNAFLRAGAARVVVPVRMSFCQAMGLYLATGIIWNGTHVPQVKDPLFVSIIQEIQESQDAPSDGKPEGTPWTFKLPTPLVILQQDGELHEQPIAPSSKPAAKPKPFKIHMPFDLLRRDGE